MLNNSRERGLKKMDPKFTEMKDRAEKRHIGP